MLAQKLLSAMAGGSETLYVDDVFSAYTRTSTGADVTVTTGIDMTKGYMLWSKRRSGATDHAIYDSARGVTKDLVSNSTAAQTTQSTGLKAVSATGHTWGTLVKVNTDATTYVDYVFARAPKFFDVVTYTGNAGTKVVPHSLGSAPGMIIVKRTDVAAEWVVYHQSVPANCGFLNLTNSFASAQRFSSVTTADFTISVSTADVNASSGTYVAYLFAHDPSADGIIQCGSYTTDAGGEGPTVTLGWEPQFILQKDVNYVSGTGGDWDISDSMRGLLASLSSPFLEANTSAAEQASRYLGVTATGFRSGGTASHTYIYLAIRRPNKPPTVGTQVYNTIARTGTGAAATVTGVGFPPDLIVGKRRTGDQSWFVDRLRGRANILNAMITNAENGSPLTNDVTAFSMDGVSLGIPYNTNLNSNSQSEVDWFFRRALGVFDIVCYTGNGGTNTQSHNLGAIPELMILKGRGTPSDWGVYVGSISQMYYKLTLQTTAAAAVNNSLFSAAPTASSFTLNTTNLNNNAGTYVAYLFATKAGISKVFNYTGNGSSQTINCGFTTGARFVLIKRTDSTGNWYVWDTVRGIIAGNDPHLSLNTTAVEVTTNDSIDPDASGFIVNQVTATNINVNAASYIGLAFA